jgi:hypothetical protein
MAPLLNDDLDRRLRATRPVPTEPDDIDTALLERILAQPRPVRRRPSRYAAPAVAVTALAAVAFFVLGGGPGGPATASAIDQALRWFDPPKGTILYARSVGTVEREVWQSADDPSQVRMREQRGDHVVETTPKAIYDSRRNTIYEPIGDKPIDKAKLDAAARKRGTAPPVERKPGTAPSVERDPDATPSVKRGLNKPAVADFETGDPIVSKIRSLLTAGRATVRGREERNGTEAWAITLSPGADRPTWTLWVAVADGRPIALDDPGDPVGGRKGEHVTWTAYDVRPAADAGPLLSLTAAHPDARVVRSDQAYLAAQERLRG